MNNKIQEAIEYFNKENYTDAIASFEIALAEDENHPNILNNIGLCYAKMAQDDKAEEYYLKALSIDSNLVQTYINLTDIYFRAGRIAESISILENAVTFMPEEIGLKHCLARFYIEDVRYDIAIDQLSEILDISPKNTDAYWDLGNIYYEMGDYDSAISCYEQLLELVENNSIIYYQTALAYEANDNIDKAISNHLKAIMHNEKFHPAYKKLGILFLARGENQDSLEYFNDYLKFDLPEEEKENIRSIINRTSIKD